MNTLFNNPLNWAATFVCTWTRFWTFAFAQIAIMVCIVVSASVGGWFAASGVAILSAAYQVMLLYALRRLFMQASAREAPDQHAA